MKTIIQILWRPLLLIYCMSAAETGFGQIITPSMDPTQPVYMPSAAGWREKPAVGFSYHEGSGHRDLLREQIYQFDDTGLEGNLAFKAGNVSVELSVVQKKTDVKLEQYHDGHINLKKDNGRLSIALAGNDFMTIGLGVHAIASKDHISAVYNDETTQSTSTIGSISVKTLDVFYLGLGFERVKEEASYAVDLTWNNLVGGLGILLGQPGSTRFRAEYSAAYSDSVENDLNGDLVANRHPATDTTRISAEIMFSGLLFSMQSEETVREVNMVENGISVAELKSVDTRGGVLWVPESGLSLGFYFLTNTVESSYDDAKGSFMVKLAYIF